MESYRDMFDTKMPRPLKASLVAMKEKFQDGCRKERWKMKCEYLAQRREGKVRAGLQVLVWICFIPVQTDATLRTG
jgi:hypothetical protein